MRSGSAGGTLSARAHSLPARGTSHVTGAHRFGRQPCTNSGRGHAFRLRKGCSFPSLSAGPQWELSSVIRAPATTISVFPIRPQASRGGGAYAYCRDSDQHESVDRNRQMLAAIPVPAGEFLCFRDTFEDAKSLPEEPDQSHFGKNTPCISASPEPTYPG